MILSSEKEKIPPIFTTVAAEAALLQAIAMVNGGFVPTRASNVELSPISTAIRKAKEEAIKNTKPGDLIPGQGIYLGRYKPKDRNYVKLGKVFNVFAAPEDLPAAMKYPDAVAYIAELKEWHGFDGTHYLNDGEIYAALKDGSYDGGWIIPPRELLFGTAPDSGRGIREDNVIQRDSLFYHQNTGAFKGTFKTSTPHDISNIEWYWSSTEQYGYPSMTWGGRILDGSEDGNFRKNGIKYSCRLVRLVEVSAP